MLETKRLILRPMSDADIEPIFAMRKDENVMRFIREPVKKREEAKKWIDLVSSLWADEKIGFCSLVEKENGQVIGWCGLWRLKETGEIEVGYAIAREFWGKGFASEAAEAFCEYGFEELNLEKIVAVASPENTASRRVMEKLGMGYDYTGEFYGRNLVHYTITREKFLSRKNPGSFTADRRG